MASSGSNASRASSADSWRAVAGRSTRPTSVESNANRPDTVSPVRAGSRRRIFDWVARQRLCRELSDNSEPLTASRQLRVSPWGAIGTPVTRGRNPRAAVFVPAPPPPPPPPGPNVDGIVFPLPGSEILEPYLLNQFPPYEVRRDMHNNNHSQWSRMLSDVQRANPTAVGAIQQFAELEKQRYMGRA